MRIRNSHRDLNINLTKCTKMTEEERRLYGMNGVSNNGNPVIKEELPEKPNNYSQGGRLKFFKDGKFILELARAREGEKVAWVPVPKKTFWPPQGSASSVVQYRQESSTTLSVSDDNSSVQSSPWQRDHTWKQTTPLRNASNHLTFFYKSHLRKPKCASYHLRRRPYASPQSSETERTKCIKGKKCNKCVSVQHKNVSLMHIVQMLWNKSLHTINSITSPRKRILKELEKVTIDDLSLKRCKGKVNQNIPISTAQTHLSEVVNVEANGNNTDVENKATSSKNCSYSITSLLRNDKQREDKLSSHFVPVNRGVTHKEPSYDTVDSHRIDIMNTTNKRSPATVSEYPPSYHPYIAPYMYGSVLGHGHGPAPPVAPASYMPTPYYGFARTQGFTPLPPAIPPPHMPHRHNGTPALYPWQQHYHGQHHPAREEPPISDVPLNLSKHAD